MTWNLLHGGLGAVGLLLSVLAIRAEEVTVDAAADTTLWEYNPTHNLGGAGMLPAGSIGEDGDGQRARLLLKFDLAGVLPDAAVITNAVLAMHQLKSPGQANAENAWFRGYSVLFDWGEGDKDYGDPGKPLTSTQAADPGEATWSHRKAGPGGAAWLSPGGMLDQDFGDDPEFEFFSQVGSDRDYNAPLNFSGLDSLNLWRNSPAANFGWVIIVEDEAVSFTARQFASREHGDPEFRPRLIISYSLPVADQPEILSIATADDVVTVDYSAAPGVVYRPQWKAILGDEEWIDLPDQGPVSVAGTLQFNDDVNGVARRFYRITIPDGEGEAP